MIEKHKGRPSGILGSSTYCNQITEPGIATLSSTTTTAESITTTAAVGMLRLVLHGNSVKRFSRDFR